jgi:hypothetical protein
MDIYTLHLALPFLSVFIIETESVRERERARDGDTVHLLVGLVIVICFFFFFFFSSPHKNVKSIIKNPFFGFSCALSKPSIWTSLPFSNNTKRSFQVRCQDLSLVPREQRWMFEESEVNGPVKPSLYGFCFSTIFICVVWFPRKYLLYVCDAWGFFSSRISFCLFMLALFVFRENMGR